MAEVTPNLGLKKPLESEFVSINTLNENLDKIDQSLGDISGVPTGAKSAAGAISELHDHLASKPPSSISLTHGVQVVQGGEVPSIIHPTMKGRTLVNLLGRDGNFNDLNRWREYNGGGYASGYPGILALDPTNALYGTTCLKITGVDGIFQTYNIKSGKPHLLVADARVVGSSTGVYLICTSPVGGMAYKGNTVNSTAYSVTFCTFMSDATVSAAVYAAVGTDASNPAYVDGFRLYEITAAEKTYIDSLTTAQAQEYIAANYPYVDDMKHVNAVYIENRGKNLIPPFSEWRSQVGVESPYKEVLTTATAPAELDLVSDIPVVGGQTYTLSVPSALPRGVSINIYPFNKNGVSTSGVSIPEGTKQITYTMPVDAIRATVQLYTTSSGTFTFENIMLNPGSIALPFEPQKPSYLYLSDCNLRSNVDGSVADQLYTDRQGEPRVTRRFKEVLLDGSLNITFVAAFTGFKVVILDAAKDAIGNTGTVVKYDGKVFKTQASNVAFSAADQAWNGDVSTGFAGNEVAISILDADHGWGETWAGTATTVNGVSVSATNLMKAYFNGWKYVNETTGWQGINDGAQTSNNQNYVISNYSNGYTPYRIMYQLPQSIDEPVTYEGSLMLHEGANQVEIGTGIVARETANPKREWESLWINILNSYPSAASELSKRTYKILRVYKDAVLTQDFYVNTSSSVINGKEALVAPSARFDPTAAYSVTYQALDTHSLGIAPQTVNADYAPNIRESLESLVREVAEARTETSISRNTKAQKQQPQWITPTPLSGWTSYSLNYAPASYYKDDSSVVRIRGLIKGGTMAANTPLFYLPEGYRPKLNVSFVGVYGAAFSPVQIVVTTKGAVMLGGAISSNSFLNIDGTFLAEH